MSKRVVIIDYGMGNTASVKKAFNKLGAETLISADPKEIHLATHIVLPGVGAFPDGIRNLKEGGLAETLNKKILEEKIPFLGICLGMQLIAEKSFEFGAHDGLGWIKGDVRKLEVNGLRLPHVGWDNIEVSPDEQMFQGITDFNFYFVHSYHLICGEKNVVTSVCQYGEKFLASLRKDNIWATQFHPEKSQTSGLRLLENFLKYA